MAAKRCLPLLLHVHDSAQAFHKIPYEHAFALHFCLTKASRTICALNGITQMMLPNMCPQSSFIQDPPACVTHSELPNVVTILFRLCNTAKQPFSSDVSAKWLLTHSTTHPNVGGCMHVGSRSIPKHREKTSMSTLCTK